MRTLFYAVSVLLTVACGLTEVREPVRNNHGGIWTGPGMNVGKEDPDRTVCYVTLMSYPEGYDWRADSEKGSVKCSLAVLADGIPMMKIPVGDEYETSSDPDMHRLSGGHLYTDYSTVSETVIKKDGRQIFRYPGREFICDMIVDSADVYTLGHSRDGGGFTYRKNGEVLLERENGRSFGRLYHDGDDICFAFSEHVFSADGGVERYYHVRGDEISQAALREDVKKVWDIVAEGGTVHYVADLIGIDAPVLFSGLKMSILAMPDKASMTACRILLHEGTVCIEGVCAPEGRPLTTCLWVSPEEYHRFDAGMTVSSAHLSGGSICCILNSSSSMSNGQIYHNGETFSMPLNYTSIGSRTAVIADGILNVGLSSKSGARPVLWKDGAVQELNYNGYICSVTTNRDQSSQQMVLD